ncbi:MAG: S-layer homology domain-containing protein [Clostridia bacterium]|nr:S-layer homology domain-containing protein [Clostridia bacterium]
MGYSIKKGFLLLSTFFVIASIIMAVPSAVLAGNKVMFAYLYAWEGHGKAIMTNNFKAQVSAAGNVNVVSPNYFYIENADGKIKDLVDPEFVQWAQLQGIKVVPMIKHGSPTDYLTLLLSDPQKRSKLVADFVALVQTYKLDGLNIDIEGVTKWNNDRDLTLFTEELSAELKKINKISSIAVFAKQGDNSPSWHSEYDYKAMGAAVDWLVIMAYDEHWTGGKPGPVASLTWVDKTLNYAVSTVPKEKILLGVPFYGYHWVKPPGSDKFAKGTSIFHSKVLDVAGKAYLTTGWDAEKGSPYLKLTDTQGEQEIWFENEQSLGLKLDLMNKYDLGGTAVWRLGFEPGHWWNLINAKLAGTALITDPGISFPPKSTLPAPVETKPEPEPVISIKFVDMERHWAAKEVTALVQKGIINGMGNNTFGPQLKVTRAQLAAMLVRAVELPLTEATAEFKDVPRHHWANQEIAAAKKAGIISGYPGESFKPESPASRGEIAKMIATAFKLEVKGSPVGFKDIKENYWAYQFILTLKSNGITSGYEDGTFRPKNNTTRAETAALIHRAMATTGVDLLNF